jgi:oxygen-independent coproporphyrinogen-3 oxidase
MYQMTEVMLEAHGLHRYEISNYALPGRECRHNIGYWTGTEYAGFGLGASGLLGDIRYRNTESLSDYLNGDFSGRIEEVRDRKAQMEEFMFLGLRMIKGVSEEEFRRRFGTAIDDIYGDVLRGLTGKELLRRIDGQIALSSRGIDLSNMVMAEFLL